jgi:hypothetical protein
VHLVESDDALPAIRDNQTRPHLGDGAFNTRIAGRQRKVRRGE